MESLDKEWIFHGNVQQCEQFEKTPNTLGLKNMAGVFILVGAGIVGGIGLIIIEVVYKKHQIKKQKRLEIARHAADKWRGTIEVRKVSSAHCLSALPPASAEELFLSRYLALDIFCTFRVFDFKRASDKDSNMKRLL